MPIDYREYHPKWKLIVRLIRKRERDHCKFCGVKNYNVVMSTPRGHRRLNQYEWDLFHHYLYVGKFSYNQCVKKVGATRIVLTIAHLDGNKDNNRFTNLAALCQRCHLNHDLGHHIMNRKYGRHHNRKHQLKIF